MPGKKQVVFELDIKFPVGELQDDPERYLGEDDSIKKVLCEKGYADENGYLTKSGREYFDSDDSIAMDGAQPRSNFFCGVMDNGDRVAAKREYRNHLNSLPKRVPVQFSFDRGDFSGDPVLYGGSMPIDTLLMLVDAGLFSDKGFLTSKGTAVFNA